MAWRPFGLNDVKNTSTESTLRSRTFGQPSSTGTLSVGGNDNDRHFLVPLESRDHILRLPRDSIKLDHNYVGAATTGICVRCRGSLSRPACDVHGDRQCGLHKDEFSQSVRSQLLGFRDSLFQSSSGASTNHLQELLSLQANLILRQQEQLSQKDQLNEALTKEKEQLISRIERLERRVSVLQKNNPPLSQDSDRVVKGQSSGPSTSPSPLGGLKRSAPHVSSSLSYGVVTNDTAKCKWTPSQKKRIVNGTSFEEDSTLLYTSNYPSPLSFPNQQNQNWDGDYGLSLASEEIQNSHDQDEIITPGWKIFNIRSSSRKQSCPEPIEDVSDEAYLKRHKKHEESERRRKRWDNQRYREQKERENLLRRYRKVHMREVKSPEDGSSKEQKLDSFSCPSREVEEIHIMDRLPVSAFGTMVPRLEPSPFSLPWFAVPSSKPRSSSKS